jgi:hypothetical protein
VGASCSLCDKCDRKFALPRTPPTLPGHAQVLTCGRSTHDTLPRAGKMAMGGPPMGVELAFNLRPGATVGRRPTQVTLVSTTLRSA